MCIHWRNATARTPIHTHCAHFGERFPLWILTLCVYVHTAPTFSVCALLRIHTLVRIHTRIHRSHSHFFAVIIYLRIQYRRTQCWRACIRLCALPFRWRCSMLHVYWRYVTVPSGICWIPIEARFCIVSLSKKWYFWWFLLMRASLLNWI